jgi:hypothetical protein
VADEQKLEQIDETATHELFVPSEIFPTTGVPRFDFQRGAVHNSRGFVINAGCNEDPAGLKAMAPDRVINVDLMAYDTGMNRANLVDKVFDITNVDDWDREFAPDSAELVVLGDVMEHFSLDVMVEVLTCVHAVAPRICITIPEDHRIPEGRRYEPGVYNEHVTVATQEVMRRVFAGSLWKPFAWIADVPWGFDDGEGKPVLGHCIEAHRV